MASQLGRMLVALVFVGAALGYHHRKEGTNCHTRQGIPGICTRIKRCPGAIYRFTQKLRLTKCSYGHEGLIICCESESSAVGGRMWMQKPAVLRGNKTAKIAHNLKPSQLLKETAKMDTSPVRRISETKCMEYGQYAYVRQRLPTLLPSTEYTVALKCYIVAEELIVGGEKAASKEFPHMAALGFEVNGSVLWACGGSLISEKFILTAAHCIYYTNVTTMESYRVSVVRLGAVNLARNDEGSMAQTLAVEKAIRHENYKTPSSYNDIALLLLATPAVINTFVRPACLHSMHGIPDAEVTTATGWGKTDAGHAHGSDDLMKVSIYVENQPERCNNSYRGLKLTLRNGIRDESMICARDITGKKDTCMGDSGGPLQVRLKSPTCMYGIIGVTSFGSMHCKSAEMPAIYTRVSYYLPWIESYVWP